jgi:hypothetical protein
MNIMPLRLHFIPYTRPSDQSVEREEDHQKTDVGNLYKQILINTELQTGKRGKKQR